MADAMHIGGLNRPNNTRRFFVRSRIVSKIPRLEEAWEMHAPHGFRVRQDIEFVSRFIPFHNIFDDFMVPNIDLSRLNAGLLSDIDALCKGLCSVSDHKIVIKRIPVKMGEARTTIPIIFLRDLRWPNLHIADSVSVYASGRFWRVRTDWNRVEREITVMTPQGLHLGPVQSLIALLDKFKSGVRLTNIDEHESADLNDSSERAARIYGKSNWRRDTDGILSMVKLGAVQGTILKVVTKGPDAEMAMQVVENFFSKKKD